MNEVSATGSGVRTPWHLWVLAVILAAYGLLAAADSVLTFKGGADYMRQMGQTPEQVAYFTSIPAWATIASTISVWAGLAGALLLLLRSRWATAAFMLAALGTAGSAIYSYFLSDGPAAMGALWLMPLVIGGVMLAMFFYARALAGRAVLR